MNLTPPASPDVQGVFALLAVLAEPVMYKTRLEELQKVAQEAAVARSEANTAATKAQADLAAASEKLELAHKTLADAQNLAAAADAKAVALTQRQENFATYENETRAELQKRQAGLDSTGKAQLAANKLLVADRTRLDKLLAENEALAGELAARKAKLEQALA